MEQAIALGGAACVKGRSAGCRRGVVDQQLHRLAAAPAVATEIPGDMDRRTTRFGKKLAGVCSTLAKEL